MSLTEDLIVNLVKHVQELKAQGFSTLEPPQAEFSAPFKRLEFIPTIEKGLGCALPNLGGEHVEERLIQIFQEKQLPSPQKTTLPRLLDKLSSIYIEPQCKAPTYIIHHPECLSPLSKSFTDDKTGQRVAARAELFVDECELANMYEEENSPFEQRRKFVEQIGYKDEDAPATVDEGYLQALEWGLPPTGGWGCGIDRLCMLLTGTTRIGDILSFGNLRTVTAKVEIENARRTRRDE